MKLTIKTTLAALALSLSSSLWAAEQYQIDTKGMHASIEFKIKHLGISWLKGKFNKFNGEFNFDEKKPSASSVNVTIDTASIDSNHGERDKHLRGDDFLDVKKYPKATFKSTKVVSSGKGIAEIHGDLTLHGVTQNVVINAKQVGAGNDPWGGFRRGFEGTTKISLHDFGIDFNLGPASKEVELGLYVEGIRK